MQGSRDKLKEVLQEKLLEFEAKVPRHSEDFIFANIGKPVRTAFPKSLLYSGALLLFLGVYFSYDKFLNVDQGSMLRVSGNTNINDDFASSSSFEAVTNTDSGIEGRRPPNNYKSSETAFVNPDHAPSNEYTMADEQLLPEHVVPGPDHALFTTAVIGNTEYENELVGDLPDSVGQASLSVILTKGASKIRFNVSVMPLMAFTHVLPSSDGVRLTAFHSAGSLDPSRFGGRVAFSVDYQMRADRFFYAGISYFTYRTAFSYNSDEAAVDILANNTVDQRVSGFGLSAGLRYPLKISKPMRHFIVGGIEAQLLNGRVYGFTSATQMMVNAGYANEIELSKGFLRIQPTVSYSVTSIQYPGLRAHPYWVGVDVAYVWPR